MFYGSCLDTDVSLLIDITEIIEKLEEEGFVVNIKHDTILPEDYWRHNIEFNGNVEVDLDDHMDDVEKYAKRHLGMVDKEELSNPESFIVMHGEEISLKKHFNLCDYYKVLEFLKQNDLLF